MIRRSAAMAPLSRDAVDQLLEACAQMALERRQIRRILEGLPDTVADLRQALNDLHSTVRP